jgi:hypothetical protein
MLPGLLQYVKTVKYLGGEGGGDRRRVDEQSCLKARYYPFKFSRPFSGAPELGFNPFDLFK